MATSVSHQFDRGGRLTGTIVTKRTKDGSLQAVAQHNAAGQLHGLSEWYDARGRCIASCWFQDDQPHGQLRLRAPFGFIRVCEFADGVRVGSEFIETPPWMSLLVTGKPLRFVGAWSWGTLLMNLGRPKQTCPVFRAFVCRFLLLFFAVFMIGLNFVLYYFFAR